MERSQPSGNDCRALNLNESNCDYFVRATNPANSGDMGGILDPQSVKKWTVAMADDAHWRHVAVTDDGTIVTVFLDGKQVAQRKHVLTPQTGPGFQVGGWVCEVWVQGRVDVEHQLMFEREVAVRTGETLVVPVDDDRACSVAVEIELVVCECVP